MPHSIISHLWFTGAGCWFNGDNDVIPLRERTARDVGAEDINNAVLSVRRYAIVIGAIRRTLVITIVTIPLWLATCLHRASPYWLLF